MLYVLRDMLSFILDWNYYMWETVYTHSTTLFTFGITIIDVWRFHHWRLTVDDSFVFMWPCLPSSSELVPNCFKLEITVIWSYLTSKIPVPAYPWPWIDLCQWWLWKIIHFFGRYPSLNHWQITRVAPNVAPIDLLKFSGCSSSHVSPRGQHRFPPRYFDHWRLFLVKF